MAHAYEIEVKSLLGSKENCEKLKVSLRTERPDMKLVAEGKQLNHYFEGGDYKKLYDMMAPLVPADKLPNLKHVVLDGSKQSVRTRQAEDKVILVVKASIGSDTSANGVERIEFEQTVSMSLNELDKKVLGAGFSYQAKWSREREEYDLGDMHVCIDKNAGYGYLSEFEKVIEDKERATKALQEIRDFMKTVGVEELEQDRLERMFTHYNAHWAEYYGTDKTFVIE
ncbi:MAG TPA: CYTH domain-containing protein [Candidatus Paceibacterota bacterium]